MPRKAIKSTFIQYNPDGTEDLDEWRARFVATMDPTEYAGALELLGSWKSWEKMKQTWPYFVENILPEWLGEQEVLMRSQAIRAVATSPNTNDQKWIAEKRWQEKKPGSPTKAQKKRRELINDDIDADIARVMGVHEVD